MEMVNQNRMRTTYYFSWPDQEILDDHVLALSCDEDTWLYTSKIASLNESYELGTLPNKQSSSPANIGASVDSRTFTRRKHGAMRTSLDCVDANNRSSLGLLSSSQLLNDSLQTNFTSKPENQEKNFSNSIASDTKPIPHRVFKLDSPFTNLPSIDRNNQYSKRHSTFARFRFDSESSDVSIPPSLENFSPFEKNEAMTDSLVNFLERQEVRCCPPVGFQDEGDSTESLVSLPSNQDNIFDLNGKSEAMTDSLVNFLEPLNCKPPNGFEDNDMASSVVSIQESDILPPCEMTKSVMDFLGSINSNPVDSIRPSETENIPPNKLINNQHASNISDRLKGCGDQRTLETDEVNTTYNLEQNSNQKLDETRNVTFTNSVNIARRQSYQVHEDLQNVMKPIKTFENAVKGNKRKKSLQNQKRAIKDLNVTTNINNNNKNENNLTRNGPIKVNTTLKRYGTYSKNELHETLSLSKPMMQRNSTFNTTFTKLEQVERGLNSTFTKSSELLSNGVEEDQVSSASDSSFSSGSTKPRSVDELRNIAQQQEDSLIQQTSTPTDVSVMKGKLLEHMDIELSPIRRPPNVNGRNNESRSANCSPVRSSPSTSPHPHAISRFQQTTMESRRQMLQASSLSNIARPRTSGLRLPQPVSRLSGPAQKSVSRPVTAPGVPVTGIPRPQVSRLPMPRFRSSAIPGVKRGGYH